MEKKWARESSLPAALEVEFAGVASTSRWEQPGAASRHPVSAAESRTRVTPRSSACVSDIDSEVCAIINFLIADSLCRRLGAAFPVRPYTPPAPAGRQAE